jgi:hypothetical protein
VCDSERGSSSAGYVCGVMAGPFVAHHLGTVILVVFIHVVIHARVFIFPCACCLTHSLVDRSGRSHDHPVKEPTGLMGY